VSEALPTQQALIAVEEARRSEVQNGIPIGSVLLRGSEVIARGHNRRVQSNDPTAHAEIECLRAAGRCDSFANATLVTTLMPCFMCAGAIVQFKIPKLVVLDDINFAGALEFMRRNGVDVRIVRDAGVIAMMADFISRHSQLWREDIGQWTQAEFDEAGLS